MDKKIIKKRIKVMISLMKKNKLNFYLVPSCDYHLSEYVADYFKHRQYLTGFTGSAGTLLLIQEADGGILWTDGRYQIQATRELEDTGIQLNCTSDKNVPPIDEYIKNYLKSNTKIGFDGRCLSMTEGLVYEKMMTKSTQKVKWDLDLASKVYDRHEQTPLPDEPLFLLPDEYTGKSIKEKMDEVVETINVFGADCTLISSLDDIAWILNLRGNDITNSPLFLSFLFLSKKEKVLFVEEKKINNEIRKYLSKNKVSIQKYEKVYDYASKISSKSKIFLDPLKTSYALYKKIKIKIIQGTNPSYYLKAIKTNEELVALRKCHIKDGIALVKTIRYVFNSLYNEGLQISELEVAKYLHERRREQEGFIKDSFQSIVAYKDHGAIMHYIASEETNYPLDKSELLLIDSGGHYYEGTTDTTRTLVLGPISKQQKRDFTLALKGLIALSSLHFLEGCSGQNLDVLARYHLWNFNIDYQCGTGHGVGYLLNVHEGPNGFRWNKVKERDDSGVFVTNMVTTIEPGVYINKEYGIRHENNVVTVLDIHNEYGQFLKFDTLTLVPFDVNGIDANYLSLQEKNFINEYNDHVRECLKSYLDEEDNKWLENYTKRII